MYTFIFVEIHEISLIRKRRFLINFPCFCNFYGYDPLYFFLSLIFGIVAFFSFLHEIGKSKLLMYGVLMLFLEPHMVDRAKLTMLIMKIISTRKIILSKSQFD